jgi:regulator of replication initiation timing
MAKSASSTTEIDPIDRLEDKLKRVVAIVERLKAEQAKALADNERLTRENGELTARLKSHDGLSTEVASLREERDVIRSRVGEMLEQLESLNL